MTLVQIQVDEAEQLEQILQMRHFIGRCSILILLTNIMFSKLKIILHFSF